MFGAKRPPGPTTGRASQPNPLARGGRPADNSESVVDLLAYGKGGGMIDVLIFLAGIAVFAVLGGALAYLMREARNDPDRTSNGEPMDPTGPF